MTKKDCSGCEDDFYNGNNQYGIGECWAFKKAKLILRKQVSIHQSPPWDQKPVKRPSCYKKKGYVFVGKDQTC